jgi:glycosyltransferase involved in cell wall biosynthesis
MDNETPLRFISIGRLLHWKGFHLGLRTFAKADLPGEVEYWVVGDGPERRNLEALVRKLGVEDRVIFWGALPREETLVKLKECDILVHPSLHDSGGLVCLEAMAAGCPVICLRLGGPDVLLTEETGLKVPAQAPDQAERDLSDAISRLARDPDLRIRMGEAARRRVNEVFDWEAKGRVWQEFYEEALRSTTGREPR